MKSFFQYFSISFTMLLFACSADNAGGNCSISCGGFGTSQPFVQTNHPFVSESECIKIAKEKAGSACKASYCPPTGDSDDCYQVYPE
ncbi:hypothetical protein [Seonamhaeicola sp.]|uniref:hypothetical protein n=1 Tax=Seonamhaeicola sp. TaxID=1912245 RepID=UPI0026308544|nr:hypothetical protein [Seonamhaeicola sp.]